MSSFASIPHALQLPFLALMPVAPVAVLPVVAAAHAIHAGSTAPLCQRPAQPANQQSAQPSMHVWSQRSRSLLRRSCCSFIAMVGVALLFWNIDTHNALAAEEQATISASSNVNDRSGVTFGKVDLENQVIPFVIPAQMPPAQCQQLNRVTANELGLTAIPPTPILPADYEAGIDAYGDAVTPAHGDQPAPTLKLPDLITFSIVVDPTSYSAFGRRTQGRLARGPQPQSSNNIDSAGNWHAANLRRKLLEDRATLLREEWTQLSINPEDVKRAEEKLLEERESLMTGLASYERQVEERKEARRKTLGISPSEEERRALREDLQTIERDVYYDPRYIDLTRRLSAIDGQIANGRNVSSLDSANKTELRRTQIKQELATIEEQIKAFDQPQDAIVSSRSAVFESATPPQPDTLRNTVATIVYDHRRQTLFIDGQPLDPAFAGMIAEQCLTAFEKN